MATKSIIHGNKFLICGHDICFIFWMSCAGLNFEVGLSMATHYYSDSLQAMHIWELHGQS